MIEFEDVRIAYKDKPVLDGVSLTIHDREFFVLIGSSGCGKTTLLKSINKLLPLRGGSLSIDGIPVEQIKVQDLPKKVGYVVQSGGLFPHLTVEENIALTMQIARFSKEAIRDRVDKMLKMVNLDPEIYRGQYPSQLSGGQQQRVGIARAFAANPPIVLMDEPFSALDPMTSRSLQQEVRNLQQKLHKTIVFVTHDMEEALDLADVIVFMDHGKIVQMAPPEEMLAHPATGQIQDFLGKFIQTNSPNDLTAADFMRTGVYSVSANRGINECVSKMQRHNVDTLLVVDDQGKYQGTVSIADIRLTGHVVKTIQPLIRCNTPTVHAQDNAKDCFDQLISSGAPYLVVLGDGEQVAGIITKTSMASAMAEQLWG